MDYTLPRPAFNVLTEALGDKAKAEVFAQAMEFSIVGNKEVLKTQLKDDLRNELITRELFEKETSLTREMFEKEILLTREMFEKEILLTREMFEERFKFLDFKMNMLIGISGLAMTFFNPVLLGFLERMIKH